MKTTNLKIVIILLVVASLLSVYSFAQKIAGGEFHSLAVCSNATVMAWGLNQFGELGDGTTTQSITPVQVSGLTGITAIAAGQFHSLALKNDGTVWAWGFNQDGELGDGTTTDRSSPIQVIGLTGISAIAAGGQHSLALKNDGTVWSWGFNGASQLGDGTFTNRTTPVQVSGLTGITGIAAGGQHSLFLKNDGTVLAIGFNGNGELGNGTTIFFSTTLVQVSSLTGITAIAAEGTSSFAVKNDGTAWAWGGNFHGELGDGTTAMRNTPVQVIGLTGITAIVGAAAHSLALKNDGTVWAWGFNQDGRLGDGTTSTTGCFCKTTPVQVSGLTGITDIAAGLDYSLTVKNDGTVWTWGLNSAGQLGDGTTTDRITPVQVIGLCNVGPVQQDCSNFKCGNKNEKVLICHIPHGNPGNPQTLCISPSALSAHLAHGDVCGPCGFSARLAASDAENIIIENENALLMEAYPNPNSGIFRIETKEKEYILIITNIIGKKILSEKIRNKKSEIDLSKEPNGIYFLQAKYDNGTETQKIIIQR